MDNIKNKTALVTGGASGLGFLYAQYLLQNGAKTVAILDLASSPGQSSTTTLVKQFGEGKALFFACDVSNTAQLAEVFKKVWQTLNGVDILINNAGILNDRIWEQSVLINVCGTIQGSLLAVDYMGKHKGGKGGTVVNISSITGLKPFPGCAPYCGTKYAVLGFSRSLAENYERTGVRVLTMCPGITTTALIVDLQSKLLDFVSEEEFKKTMNVPLQPPEVVAEAMMSLIQKGKTGDVWLSEENQPPCALEFPPVKKIPLNL